MSETKLANRFNTEKHKPRILLLADFPNWAYNTAAKAIVQHLSDEFDFRIDHVSNQPDLNAWPFDLIYVFFWGEKYHRKFVRDPRRVIKQISSHRWEFEEDWKCGTPAEMVERYLYDAATITATSKRLQSIFSPYREVLWVPNGFEPTKFFHRKRSGELRIGWAGNENDQCKGLKDILIPAVGKDFKFYIAGGNLEHKEMLEFYNSIDVLCIASIAEGEPLTLIEGMACGCFPVCVDVGIVPELVTHQDNGLIVDRTVSAFTEAFEWCKVNIDYVREAGERNARQLLRTRTWEETNVYWRHAFRSALQNSSYGFYQKIFDATVRLTSNVLSYTLKRFHN